MADTEEPSVPQQIPPPVQEHKACHLKMSSNIAEKLLELKTLCDLDQQTEPMLAGNNEPKPSQATQICKQVFVPNACLPFENNIVYCFILSVWDNIIGPQTVQVWKRKPNPRKTTEVTNNKSSARNVLPDASSLNDIQGPIPSTSGTSSQPTQLRKGETSKDDESQIESPTYENDRQGEEASRSATTAIASKSPRYSEQTSQLNEMKNSGMDHPSSMPKSKRSGNTRLQSIVQYVTEHTVTLSQVQLQQEEQLSPTILILPHHSIIVQAVRFLVREEDGGIVPYCLSMVVPQQEEQQLLQVSALTGSHLVRTVKQLHVMLTQENCLPRIGERFEAPLLEVCSVLVSLRRCSLSRYPLLPGAQPPSDRLLTTKLLTSHLCTLGCTVVVADSSTSVNKVVMWLALFLQPRELHLSRLCIDPHRITLQPGLLLQGVVRGEGGAECVSGERLLQFGRPVTLCDLTTRTVRQTVCTPNQRAPANREVVREVTEVSSLVRQFLLNLELLSGHSNEVRTGFVRAFTRSLRYQALAAATWLNHARHEKQSPQQKQQQLRDVLGLDDASLSIVLAMAEQLQPGITTTTAKTG